MLVCYLTSSGGVHSQWPLSVSCRSALHMGQSASTTSSTTTLVRDYLVDDHFGFGIIGLVRSIHAAVVMRDIAVVNDTVRISRGNQLSPLSLTFSPAFFSQHLIRQQPMMTAINSCIEVDITGQVCQNTPLHHPHAINATLRTSRSSLTASALVSSQAWAGRLTSFVVHRSVLTVSLEIVC